MKETEELKRELEEYKTECVTFRRAWKTGARTIWHFYGPQGRLVPIYEKRSATRTHGEDCYKKSDLDSAIIGVKIEVSNSGKDYSDVYLYTKKIPIAVLRTVIHDFKDDPIILEALSKKILDNPEIELVPE